MLNASVGVQRVLGRVRRSPSQRPATAPDVQPRTLAAARRVRHGLHSIVAASRLVPARESRPVVKAPVADTPATYVRVARRRSLLGRLGPDRAVAIAVVGILVGASVVSMSAGHATPNTGNTNGAGQAPRIVVGGDTAQAATGQTGSNQDGSTQAGNVAFGQPDPTAASQDAFGTIDLHGTTLGDPATGDVEGPAPVSVEGPFADDGTLIKPIAVDTTVRDGSALVKTYTVKAGDDLPGIASQFSVSTMSVVWANNLKSKTDIHTGEVLRIPPISGLIVRVAATDTLDAIAARYDVNGTDILATNGLDDQTLIVGQVLVIPGAQGLALPEAKPLPGSGSHYISGATGSNIPPPSSYTGGKFLWPVVGGGNYISQYFHPGHYAIDIAADYGSEVRAAAAGTVIFAGWKNNGGGYQVWIAHGSGLYTTYNHMSAVSVGAGQHVARGQQVGKIGMTGDATGPHCHFEVWRGPVWNGGTRVNPLAYF